MLLYKIFGMSFFDSITHSMTTIATGGFSNYNQSIGYFNNFYIVSHELWRKGLGRQKKIEVFKTRQTIYQKSIESF